MAVARLSKRMGYKPKKGKNKTWQADLTQIKV
jgi:hypothetical protein